MSVCVCLRMGVCGGWSADASSGRGHLTKACVGPDQ